MSFTFQPEENETVRMSYTKGQTIYQIIITDTNFQSLYVDVQSISKCFCGGGKIDDNTTAAYFVKDLAGGTFVTVSLEIRFQKSKKMKTAIEEFEFILTKIDRDQQLEEIVKLKKENEILAKKVRIMETYQMGYYDHRYLSENKDCVYFPIEKHRFFDFMRKEHSYIWKHKRFIKYQSMFKLSEQGRHYYERIITTLPRYPGEHASQEQKEKFEIDTFVWHYPDYFKNSPPSDQRHIKLYDMKMPSQKYEKMAQYHAEIEMITTFFDLTMEYRLRGKILMPPTLYGDRYYMIQHPTDPEHITHTFDLLKHLRHPPTAADRLFFNPEVGFYQTPTEFL